jgi:tRNA(adenine34) deaminase
MTSPDTDATDRAMMTRCIALSVQSGEAGEYPYGVVIQRAGAVIVESINRVAHEHDVTRHAEVVAISLAQKALGTVSLSDCTIYVNAEPCAYCCYGIRESRIGRVVYGLHSPHMGGVTKWRVLTDDDLSNTMPETFDPPPEIVAGYMAHEADRALFAWNPLVWGVIRSRRLFVPGAVETARRAPRRRLTQGVSAFLRRTVFDKFGRGG